MTAAEWVTVFAGLSAFVASLASAYVSIKSAGKVRGMRKDLEQLENTTSDVRSQVNGRMSMVLKAHEKALRTIVRLKTKLRECEVSLHQLQRLNKAQGQEKGKGRSRRSTDA